ncbi:hypothetical protein [Spirochaeta cellobiosiphila]|uniref:hypothetical protein n=1 Tax=Spirochaeta cellobiosiphila TaxID=504483 RepID=UPI00040FEC29|nr:hypothetical protein [Spirochaeta cellobiosiphila]
MKRLIIITSFLLLLLTYSLSAETSHSTIYIAFGFDYGLASLTTGYSHSINKDLDVSIDFTIPTVKMDTDEYRLRVGGDLRIFEAGSISIPLHSSLVYRGFGNSLVKGHGLGMELGMRPGVYFENWSLGGEFIWDRQLVTYLKHSDYYKRWFYKDVKDGWYSASGDTLRLGIVSTYSLSDSFALGFNGGYEYHGLYKTVAPPAYLVTTARYIY